MRLEQLDEDILCFILCICDVYTVLSMSQVNRSFKRIADSKHIWICLIADLAARGLIDLPHDCPFREFSTAQLREEIKRIVLGPQTWSCPSRSSPIVSREFRIPGDSPPPRLQLLLGGTHLIVEHTSRIELWHIATSAVIWSCVHTESFFWRRCVAELGDKRFVILLSVDPHVLRIIHIDLDTGHSAELFRIEPPQGAEFLNEPLLSGDFFLCELTWWYAQSYRLFMVGNWRTWTHTVLRYEPTLGLDSWLAFQIELVGGHIFFTAHRRLPPHNQGVYALSLKELLARSPPNSSTSTEGSINVYDVPATIVHELPNIHPCRVRMMVYESPLRHDTYKVMIYMLDKEPPAPRRYSLKWMFQNATALSERITQRGPYVHAPCTVCTFRFSISNENAIDHWALTSSVAGFPLFNCYGIISYAGYHVTHGYGSGVTQRVVNVYVRDPRTRKRRDTWHDAVLVVGKEVAPQWRSLSPYSHAVSEIQGSNYVISYYL